MSHTVWLLAFEVLLSWFNALMVLCAMNVKRRVSPTKFQLTAKKMQSHQRILPMIDAPFDGLLDDVEVLLAVDIHIHALGHLDVR